MLSYEDVGAAIDWLGEAFGFRESGERFDDAEGHVTHAELSLDGATVRSDASIQRRTSRATAGCSCNRPNRLADRDKAVHDPDEAFAIPPEREVRAARLSTRCVHAVAAKASTRQASMQGVLMAASFRAAVEDRLRDLATTCYLARGATTAL
jgi:hypothetical protein